MGAMGVASWAAAQDILSVTMEQVRAAVDRACEGGKADIQPGDLLPATAAPARAGLRSERRDEIGQRRSAIGGDVGLMCDHDDGDALVAVQRLQQRQDLVAALAGAEMGRHLGRVAGPGVGMQLAPLPGGGLERTS